MTLAVAEALTPNKPNLVTVRVTIPEFYVLKPFLPNFWRMDSIVLLYVESA